MQAKLDFQDVPGETHAPDGPPKEIGMPFRGAFQYAAVRDAHLERRDVPVLIFPMHVGGHHPAERHELGSG